MYRIPIAFVALAGAFLLANPTLAVASNVVDQYTEQVPTPGGDKPTSEATPDVNRNNSGGGTDQSVTAVSGGGRGGGPGGDLPTGTTKQAGGLSTSASPPNERVPSDGSTKITEVFDGSSDGGGLGLLFPLILLTSLGAVIAIVVLRRRGSSNGSQVT